MKIELINSKLAKSETINDIINIEEEIDNDRQKVLAVSQNDVGYKLFELLELYKFPIEKIVVYDDMKDGVENVLLEYTDYHSLLTANTSLRKVNGTLAKQTLYKFV